MLPLIGASSFLSSSLTRCSLHRLAAHSIYPGVRSHLARPSHTIAHARMVRCGSAASDVGMLATRTFPQISRCVSLDRRARHSGSSGPCTFSHVREVQGPQFGQISQPGQRKSYRRCGWKTSRMVICVCYKGYTCVACSRTIDGHTEVACMKTKKTIHIADKTAIPVHQVEEGLAHAPQCQLGVAIRHKCKHLQQQLRRQSWATCS